MEYVKIFEYDHFSDYIDDLEEPINDELKKKRSNPQINQLR